VPDDARWCPKVANVERNRIVRSVIQKRERGTTEAGEALAVIDLDLGALSSDMGDQQLRRTGEANSGSEAFGSLIFCIAGLAISYSGIMCTVATGYELPSCPTSLLLCGSLCLRSDPYKRDSQKTSRTREMSGRSPSTFLKQRSADEAAKGHRTDSANQFQYGSSHSC
jgi:hypothetical protein